MAARPIIVIKKKVAHGGHHGGAWKVAYADFVTAMMALFIVLWLLNSSKQIREAVGGYFKDPTGTSKKVGSGKTGAGDNFTLTKDNMNKLKDELQKAVRKVTDFEKLKNQIEMTVTAEGLRIELMESEKGTFFASGVAEPSDDGRQILLMLAQELAKLPNTVSIEGHTDAKPFAGKWQLQQLGTLRRSRQCRPPHDAAERPRPAAGNAGAGLRRSAAAQARRTRRIPRIAASRWSCSTWRSPNPTIAKTCENVRHPPQKRESPAPAHITDDGGPWPWPTGGLGWPSDLSRLMCARRLSCHHRCMRARRDRRQHVFFALHQRRRVKTRRLQSRAHA